MHRTGRLALLAALLAMLAMGGRVVAASHHLHAGGDHGHDRCALCHAVHEAGTAPEAPEAVATPTLVREAADGGRCLPPVLVRLTARSSRGPPALRS